MQINLPAFGATIPGQGGRFAAICRGPMVDGAEKPPYALLVSDKATGDFPDVKWGEYKDVADCDSRTNGQANTIAMVGAESPASLKVAGLEAEGHRDFYVPSIGELNAAAANVPELFEEDGVYWSSTQISRHLAFVQDFEGGLSLWSGKGLEFRVRAVRQIPLELLNA